MSGLMSSSSGEGAIVDQSSKIHLHVGAGQLDRIGMYIEVANLACKVAARNWGFYTQRSNFGVTIFTNWPHSDGDSPRWNLDTM